jgi:hypothetical protein
VSVTFTERSVCYHGWRGRCIVSRGHRDGGCHRARALQLGINAGTRCDSGAFDLRLRRLGLPGKAVGSESERH